MRIATWNIERLKHKNQINQIIDSCMAVKADILVVTESDRRLQLDYKYCHSTPALVQDKAALYEATENRVSIFTNYPCVRQYSTYDENTSICVELKTELGNLIVYGTIIGILGNRHSSFIPDLKSQMADVQRLSNLADGFCICGDFNCSFADNYYFTKIARSQITETFSQNNICLLTEMQPECIDHIAVSRSLVKNSKIIIEEWNDDKKLSDHKGISVLFGNDS